jgi:NAD+ synthase (glutamine-hydrolysing)
MHNGFFRVAACIPPVRVADVKANTAAIIDMLHQMDRRGVELAVFPELCVTGYTCGDLFHNDTLLSAAGDALTELVEATKELHVHAVIGVPMLYEDRLYNCAVVIGQGAMKLTVPKTYMPNYNEFYERRLWTPAPRVNDTDETRMHISPNKLCQINGVKIGIEICEDLWVPIPPSSHLAMAGAKVIVNLSASPDTIGKYDYLRQLIAQQSARCMCGYVYAAAGFGESSTDLVFDGKGLIAENGRILAATERWQSGAQYVIHDLDIEMLTRDRLHHGTYGECADRENQSMYPVVQQINLNLSDLLDPENTESIREKIDKIIGSENQDSDEDEMPTLIRTIDPHPFVPWDDNEIDKRCDEIINLQVAGLAQRLNATGCKCLVVGISGGLDSTLALLVATRAFDRLGLDRKGIIGITMPGFGTTGRTHSNALSLMDALGVTFREIPIGPAVERHFSDIGHDAAIKDVTYENCQARERTQILMDVANKEGGMVLGTGDLSELALGWATYNGDQMSMYGVNASVPKTLVKYLVRWFALRSENPDMAEALVDIIDTPVSPELLPPDESGKILQKTEDLVGPYELHDFFLYYMLRYGYPPERVFYLACEAFWHQHRRKTYQGKGGMEVGKYEPRVILKWMGVFYRRFFAQQFKRSCMPDGPKIGSVCLSPRGDWRMPSDASAAIWLASVEKLAASLNEE